MLRTTLFFIARLMAPSARDLMALAAETTPNEFQQLTQWVYGRLATFCQAICVACVIGASSMFAGIIKQVLPPFVLWKASIGTFFFLLLGVLFGAAVKGLLDEWLATIKRVGRS